MKSAKEQGFEFWKEKEMNNEIFKKAFNHTLTELEIYNITESIKKGNFEMISKAHDSIHEFIYLAPLSVTTNKNLDEKSAFLKVYLFEIFYAVHNSFLMTLMGFYNASYVLLRTTLELLIKGALWECLAHKKFRNKSEILRKNKIKIGKLKKTIIDWLNEIIERKPSIEKKLEETSAAIFDKIYPLPKDPTLKKLIPPPKICINQLNEWGIFNPVSDAKNRIYNFYSRLSANIHVVPDEIDVGRRLLSQKDLYEIEIIPDELNNYCKQLQEIMDIGIVIELNILQDLITQNKEVQNNLKERLKLLEDLHLPFAYKKLSSLVKE